MTSQGTPLPVASAPVSRPSNATPLSAQVPAPEEGTGLFGGAEEVVSSQAPRRNSRVVLAPRPSSGIQPSQASVEKQDVDSTNNSVQDLVKNDANQNLAADQPLSSNPTNLPANVPSLRRQKTGTSRRAPTHEWTTQPTSQEKPYNAPLTDRLQPTIDHAISERDKYAIKAKWTGWVLNAAIGLQVLLGSLTTGLSAVATNGRSAAVNTTILGALTTIVASYLARARGSNEPELSISRTKDLDQFIRECEAFKLDYGYDRSGKYDDELNAKRKRFEELLGNANGERKLATPV